jgi:pimeloyl-ACP methyl ester carboxylesterase
LEAYGNGDHEGALAILMSVVGGTDWPSCRAMLEELLPGAVAQAIKDADTFFGVELPGLTEWAFGPEQPAAIHCPVLSVLGTDTHPVWVETAEFLRSSLTHVEESLIADAGHLLQVQRLARAMASSWRATRSSALTPVSTASRPGPRRRSLMNRSNCTSAMSDRSRGRTSEV